MSDHVQLVIARLERERQAALENARVPNNYKADLAAARAWAFGLAIDLLTGVETL